jgi:hypothetical protein
MARRMSHARTSPRRSSHAVAGACIALLAALACRLEASKRAKTAPEPTVAASTDQAHTSPGAPSATAGNELIVGSERGLDAYGLDGVHRRTISPGAALHPRWFDADSVIVLAPRDPQTLGAGARLQRISLADGRRRELAVLPPFACEPRSSEPSDSPFASFPYPLDLQDGSDFELSLSAGLVCLQLLDRNINMASVVLDVRVDLRTGRVERWLSVGEDVCTPPRDVRLGSAPNECSEAPPPAASAAPARAYPYDMPHADGRVIQTSPQGEHTALQLGSDYSAELYSPSRRWLVLGGDTEEGDYLYRRLSLLDRENGRVYPIVPGAAWPEPLEPTRGSPPTLPPIERAVLEPRETDVRWLGGPDTELLVVGHAIVRPGVGSFAIDGSIAR